ncbi:MAG TPA: hypothetical protein VES89_02405 [Candidatus Competibacteraceae bacterium]|nr:hypothetical protein [Candidatus Competibacteraceae bacterium]
MGLTLIPKGLTLLAGGCRYYTPLGEQIEKWCDECLLTQRYPCALEPLARELAQRLGQALCKLAEGAVTEAGIRANADG